MYAIIPSAVGRPANTNIIQNFREFVDILGQKGVDTRHVEVAKAELTMWRSGNVVFSYRCLSNGLLAIACNM